MTLPQALLLGLVQGLTEFLPVSSSGHLVLLQYVLDVDPPGISFEVITHFGTLLAVFTAFRKDLKSLISSALRAIGNVLQGRNFRLLLNEDPNLNTILFILLATVPIAIAGIFFKSHIEYLFSIPQLVPIMLIVTGTFLWCTRYSPNHARDQNAKDTVLIGIAQAFAILPGISRSGFTIGTALLRGVHKEQAVRFSFLLAIPAILGVTVFQINDLIALQASYTSVIPLITATAAAYISGYAAIRVILEIVRRGTIERFSYYCWAVGSAGLIAML